MQKYILNMENFVDGSEIAKLTDFFFLEASIGHGNQKDHFHSVVRIQRFCGFKHAGMTCVVDVNERPETHSLLPTACQLGGDGCC